MLEEGDPYAASDPETLAIRLVAERSLDRVSNEDVRVGSISVAVAEVLNEGLVDKEEGDSSHVSKNVVLLHHHMLPRMRTHPALERIVVWLLKRRGPSLVGFTLTQAVLYRHPPSLPPSPSSASSFRLHEHHHREASMPPPTSAVYPQSVFLCRPDLRTTAAPL